MGGIVAHHVLHQGHQLLHGGVVAVAVTVAVVMVTVVMMVMVMIVAVTVVVMFVMFVIQMHGDISFM